MDSKISVDNIYKLGLNPCQTRFTQSWILGTAFSFLTIAASKPKPLFTHGLRNLKFFCTWPEIRWT